MAHKNSIHKNIVLKSARELEPGMLLCNLLGKVSYMIITAKTETPKVSFTEVQLLLISFETKKIYKWTTLKETIYNVLETNQDKRIS